MRRLASYCYCGWVRLASAGSVACSEKRHACVWWSHSHPLERAENDEGGGGVGEVVVAGLKQQSSNRRGLPLALSLYVCVCV